MMGKEKYNIRSNLYGEREALFFIANELAEMNRLKRLEQK